MLEPTKVIDIPGPFRTYEWRAATMNIPERYYPHIGDVQLKEYKTELGVFWEYEMTVHNKKRKKVGEIHVKDDKPQFRLRWRDPDGLYRFHKVSEGEFRAEILGWFSR
jgi:hypothetical protein